MTKENKLKIGLALHGIALMTDEGSYKRIKDRLKEIEDIVDAEPLDNDWIPIGEVEPPETGYILLSFANFSIPLVGHYETDGNGGAFYVGDESESCLSQDIIVNAWMRLPECYREDEA